LPQGLIEDDGHGHRQVQALDHAHHWDAHDPVGEGERGLRDALGLAAEDEGHGPRVIDFRVGDGLLLEMGGDDGEAGLLERGETIGGRAVDVDLQPLVGAGRDGLVEAEELRVGGDEVEVEDPGRVAGPHDGARVMGDGHALEHDAEVGLAEGKDAVDPGDSLGCRHGPTIAESGGGDNG